MKYGTSAKLVNKRFASLFARYGLPDVIVTDGGPPFNSSEFVNFLEHQGIKVLKSPPYNPASNGQAERLISVGNHVTTAHKNQLKMIYVPKQRSKVYVTMREAAKKRKRGSIEDEDEFTGFPDIPSVAEDAGHTNKKFAQTRSPIITRSKAALSTNYSASDS
ncbi:uncharacterized protein LOC134222990 [Armigeres subalbatus]|uniref:uncharacterized protein LOC134222990 n=1 Tax=Armigeres subalbatus TaxID=124917 RepID=UPI002ED2F12A